MSTMRLRLCLQPQSTQEFERPTLGELQRSVWLLQGNPGATAELAYFDTRVVVRALEGDRYLVEYSDPTIGTWIAERRGHAAQPPLSLVIDDRERLVRGAQLVGQVDVLRAFEDFLDGATRSGRLAWSSADGV